MARKIDNKVKSVRIHDEKVNDWIESLPYGKFTEMINKYLKEVYDKAHKGVRQVERDINKQLRKR